MRERDAVMDRINGAIARLQNGDVAGARESFTTLWEEIGPAGDPLHRCALAHYMADTQDEVSDELAWDLRALEAAAELTDERLRVLHPSLSLEGFYPSLHLNLAEDYRRLGEFLKAREHLAKAAALSEALPQDELGNMLRQGIARMADLLKNRAPPNHQREGS
jgi:tetratricopeptide (TPR) repeat protein